MLNLALPLHHCKVLKFQNQPGIGSSKSSRFASQLGEAIKPKTLMDSFETAFSGMRVSPYFDMRIFIFLFNDRSIALLHSSLNWRIKKTCSRTRLNFQLLAISRKQMALRKNCFLLQKSFTQFPILGEKLNTPFATEYVGEPVKLNSLDEANFWV